LVFYPQQLGFKKLLALYKVFSIGGGFYPWRAPNAAYG
jgi:hypothetical protein